MRADPTSEVIILEIPQPFGNHNGGQLAFGPDGYLYIGVGDGGSGGDPLSHGQNLATMLGAVLRIRVDGTSHDTPYLIPKDNPFLDIEHAQGEIWAHGLRNPWRFSFDEKTGHLWLGDVGQSKSEEINLIYKGGNYGWAEMEGSTCYPAQNECTKADFHAPITEYGRSEGCTIIGGFVYRGAQIADLKGYYVYSDYCSGKIWAIKYESGHAGDKHLLYETNLSVTSFGQDRQKGLYVLSRNSGIYRLTHRN
jgi:glucose/arabinose dehydrogenase